MVGKMTRKEKWDCSAIEGWFWFSRKCDGTSSSRGIETQLYPPRPMVEECIFAGLGKGGSGGGGL